MSSWAKKHLKPNPREERQQEILRKALPNREEKELYERELRRYLRDRGLTEAEIEAVFSRKLPRSAEP